MRRLRLAKGQMGSLAVAMQWAQRATSDDMIAGLAALVRDAGENDDLYLVSEMIMGRLAEREGEVAVGVAEGLQKIALFPSLVARAYLSWAEVSPQQAFDHAMSHLSSDDDKQSILEQLFRQIDRTDRELAGHMAIRLADSKDNDERLAARSYRRGRVAAWLQADQPAADVWRWVGAEATSSDERSGFLEEILQRAVEKERDDLAVEALKRLSRMDGGARYQAIDRLSERYPQAVLDYISREDPSVKVEAILEMVNVQTDATRPMTVNAVMSWPDVTERNEALVRIADTLKETPLLAWKALSGVSEGDKKTEAMHSLGFSWLDRNPAEARNWLPAAVVQHYEQLSEMYRSGLLNVIPGAEATINFRFPSLEAKAEN